MPLNLFIATICQETNDFSPIPTNRESFNMQAWTPGHNDEAAPQDVELLGYGGFLARARADGQLLHLGPFLAAQPAAPMSNATWQALKQEVLGPLARAGKVDGVFLFLHGACSAQGVSDCEGELLEEVRAMVGAGTPIALELDLHGNMTRRMAQYADIIVACQEYPHVDFGSRGGHAYDLLVDMIAGRSRPCMAVRKLPFCGIFPTTSGPMKDFVDRLKEVENQPGILSASALHGFFASDNEEMGGAVIVVSDGDKAFADVVADRLSEDLIATVLQSPRDDLSVDDALDLVEKDAGGPIVLADRTDNPGGGAACDSTWILHALLRRNMTNVALGGLWDPVAADLAHRAGEGAVLPMRIGGKIGPLSGDPVDLEASVIALRDDVHQAFFGVGAPTLPMGRSALVKAKGIEIILMSERQQVFDARLFTGFGVDLASKKLIVVKSTHHFHTSFAPIASRILYCQPPGTCTTDMRLLPYRRIKRPIYPLDADAIVPQRLL